MNENKPGNWIREHRIALGLRQSDVAMRAGVSPAYVSALERGQKHSQTNVDIRPDPDKVRSIAKAVEGDANDLLLLFGYAPESLTSGKPQNVQELLKRLEALGVDNIHFKSDDAIRNASPDELQEVLDAVRLAVELTLQRNRQNPTNATLKDDREGDALP